VCVDIKMVYQVYTFMQVISISTSNKMLMIMHCSSTITQNVILEFQNLGWYKANQCHLQKNLPVFCLLMWLLNLVNSFSLLFNIKPL